MTDPGEADKLRIFEEAAAHFAKLTGGDATAADREALTAWLLADERHAQAYRNVERLWESAGEVPGLKTRGKPRGRPLTRRDLGKGAGALAVAYLGWRYLETHPFADVRTGKGERRTVRMADGSTVELSAQTRLSTDFGADERRLVLHEGEAFFSVAPEAGRPFVVEAGAGEIRALGTAFGVGFDSDRGRVVVTESAVGLRVGGRRVEVGAGSRATFGTGRLGPVEPADGAAELSWREGRLTFVQAPLGEVVAEVNRWREGRIVILERSLAARPVTLIVDLARLETVLPKLAEASPLRFVSVTRWLTFVVSRA